MTVKELSQLYWLNREIEADQVRLDKLVREIEADEIRIEELRRRASSPSSPNMSGMPSDHSGFSGSKIERYIGDICDLEEELRKKKDMRNDCAMVIHANQILCLSERNKLERYIADIPDSLLRQIFTLRFINGLPWLQVAFYIGGGNTADSVKKQCYRYLEQLNGDTE